MKATTSIIWILAASGLGACLALEHQASLKLERDNNALRGRVSQMNPLVAENQRLSNLVAEANGLPSRPNRTADVSVTADDPAQELARLRREAESLRQQTSEIETLRANTAETRASAETAAKHFKEASNRLAPSTSNGSQLELLRADYWTANTNLDVASELRDRIRGDSLKAIASNNLKGDPDFGQVKHLTVVYRFGGVTMTNEFREGDFVVLPKELGQQSGQ
ncbi:MAG: beta-lactamase class [Verrucomicrobiota bacterium]